MSLDATPASAGSSVKSSSGTSSPAKSAPGSCVQRFSKLVSHHVSSGGKIGAPSGRQNGGFDSPRCAALSASSIHASSAWTTAAASGCGFKISWTVNSCSLTLASSSRTCDSLERTLRHGSVPTGECLYNHWPDTSAAASKQASTSWPAADHAAATSSKRSAGGMPTALNSFGFVTRLHST